MKIAIRNNDLFTNYAERFSDDEITAEPYNYQIAIVPDDIDIASIKYIDFDISDDKYNFNATKFTARIIAEKEKISNYDYKTKIDKLIRQRYSINDELAILRQRDSKPEEYAEYNAYCEECKAVAKKEVYGA